MAKVARAVRLVLALALIWWMTVLFAALLAGVFFLEAGNEPDADHLTAASLLGFGGFNGYRVLVVGEWYRFGSAMLLHASPEHLLANEAALLVVGLVFEAVFGWAWFLLAFCLGGLGASLMSLATDPSNLTVVGASGAIMGLCAAGFLGSFRVDHPAVDSMRFRSFIVLLLTLLPWLGGVPTPADVDDAGHVGGMMGGALVGLLIWQFWRAPRRGMPATLALPVGLFVMVAAATAGLAALHSPFLRLLPNNPVATTQAEAEQLVTDYPGDPRAWDERGRALYEKADYHAAEPDFRKALQLTEQLRPIFTAEYRSTLRGLIAFTLSLQGDQAAGVAMAQAPCRLSAVELGQGFYDALRQQHLCGD